jgi:hypothetical protein
VVRPTQRDLEVLRWLGEMYGAPLAVVGQLYGTGDRVTRRHAARLEQAGFASRQLAPGGAWLVPTLRGLRYAGLDYAVWPLVGWKAEHLAAVARLRLEVEAAYPDGRWTSERAVRADWHGTGARVRIPDGILDLPGCRVGLEVELHRKGQHRYPGILADVDPSLDRVWWLVRSVADSNWLQHVLEGIPKPERPVHEVMVLARHVGASS